jgi:hypothetical protein
VRDIIPTASSTEEMTHKFITMCFPCGERGHLHP